MPYPALCIANEFLRLAWKQGQSLSPMKLQKLVYFAHGWCLALTNQPLVADRIEAWQFGPVIPKIYHEFKRYGNGPITEEGTEFSMRDGKLCLAKCSFDQYAEDEQVEEARKLVQKIYDVYSPYSAIKLSNATHEPGTPWQQTFKDNMRNLVIPDDVIKDYFQGLVNAGK